MEKLIKISYFPEEMEYLIPREIEAKISPWLESKEILIIRGPRQSGKTTLLHKIARDLSGKGIKKERIHFFNLEDDLEKEKLEKDPKNYFQFYLSNDTEKHYFFIDEVQYLSAAGKILKLIYDSQFNLKIVVTGSSTLDLSEVGSYLVGRALFFELYPFSFYEFIQAKDHGLFEHYKKYRFNPKKPVLPPTLFLDKLNLLLWEYATYGGYPRIVLEKDLEKKKFILKNLYLTYIEKDIVKIYGSKYRQKILDLVKTLAALNASILNYSEISTTTSLYFKEIKDILGILENTYIISLITPFHKNLVSELRKNPKLYFFDLGLRNFLINRFEFTDEEKGKLLENVVFSNFREEKVNYWRTTAKAEVDFFLAERNLPIEVKLHPKVTRSLHSFLDDYQPPQGLLINLSQSSTEKVEKTELWIIPAAFL